MVKRPYLNAGIQELTSLSEVNWDCSDILSALKDELRHRKTPKAKKLFEEVNKRISELQNGNRTSVPNTRKKQTSKTAVPTEPSQSNKKTNLLPKTNDEEQSAQPKVVTSTEKNHYARPSSLKRISAPHQPHLPIRKEFKAKEDTISFQETNDVVKNFIQILELHIEELKREGSNQIILLEDGKRIMDLYGNFHYRFPFHEEVNLMEGVQIQINIGGKQANAQLLSLLEGTITISTKDDFGDSIESAQLRIDNSALLVSLKEQLEKVSKGEAEFGLECAKKVLGIENFEVSTDESTPLEGLSGRPEIAVRTALGSATMYLWGPPGTGKTTTLSKLVLAFYKQDKRVLIVSNTNLAVDTLLEKVCDDLENEKDMGFERGAVLRSGRPQKPEVLAKYEDKVVVAKVVERLSFHLREEQDALEIQINELQLKMEPLFRIISDIDQLVLIESQVEAAKEQHKKLFLQKSELEQKLLAIDREKVKLEAKLVESQTASGIAKMFRGLDPKRIQQEIEKNKAERETVKDILLKINNEILELDTGTINLKQKYLSLQKKVAGKSRAVTQQQLDSYQKQLNPLNQKLSEVKKQLEQLQSEVLNSCKILAATATQTFLKPNDFSSFDVVIIDEASMLTLPTVFYVSGLGKQHVIVAGDFLQLPPIVQTKQEVIRKWIGTDIFTFAGIVEKFERRQNIPQLIQLDTQYRMDSRICELINTPFYQGTLKTGRIDAPRQEYNEDCPPVPFSGPLTIVDTSSVWPFVNKKNGTTSRYNILHAIAIRNLCVHLQKSGYIVSSDSVGIASPYAAQAELIGKICDEVGLKELVCAGTVHRYQGNQKHFMVVDIADSIGEYTVSQFCQSNRKMENGAKLFNVAFSRSCNHLVVFANLTYLEEKLPTDSLLRILLYDMQTRGEIVDVQEVLALGPGPGYDLRMLQEKGLPLDFDVDESGWFNQKTFDAAFSLDMSTAKKSIAIFSGFATASRVAKWSDIFRERISQGVKIRCITRPPQDQGTIPNSNVKEALNALENLGVTIDLRSQIHEKIAIIDGNILWFGSLNPLSHTGHTDEMMLRVESNEACKNLAVMLAARKSFSVGDDALSSMVQRENPICGGSECEALTVLKYGRYGPYFDCLESCGWSESVDKPKKKSKSDLTPLSIEIAEQDKICSECGKQMAVKKSRWGSFFLGCTGYPDCKVTKSLK